MNIQTQSIQELIEDKNINKNKPLFFDVETIGLYGKIRLAQFYLGQNDTVIVCENPDVNQLIEFIDTCHIVSHNIHYEITTIQQQSKSDWIPKRFDCTFLLAKLQLYSSLSHSFDNCLNHILQESVYDNKKEMQTSDWSTESLTKEQLEYAAKDVYYLPTVWNVVKQSLESDSYRLDKVTLEHCLDFQNTGLHVDIKQLENKVQENLSLIEEINLPLNSNSHKQVKEYLEREGSCDDANLAHMIVVEGNPKARDIRKTRKLLKQNSFCKKFITENNRIYGKFSPAPKNGRLSCKDQNLQQIPRDLKNLFGVPRDNSKILVYADFSQLEIRAICAIIGEPTMEKIYRSGGDLHEHTAKILFGDDFTHMDADYYFT